MSDIYDYFLNSKASVAALDTLEISHPNFTQTYWIVRNAAQGITATLETGAIAHFDYYPLRLRPAGASDDLEHALQCDLGDLGEIIPKELDAIREAGGFGIKPIVRYRIYRSDDLSAPMLGPEILEIGNLGSKLEGSSFEAKAPSLDINRTGEIYRLERFPMLRGFVS